MSYKLWLALDESNHSRYPEIVSAIFSIRAEDVIDSSYTSLKKMPLEEMAKFIRALGREAFILSLEEGQLERTENQLVVSAPAFVRAYQKAHKGDEFDLGIRLDGEGRKSHSSYLVQKINEIRGVSLNEGDILFCPKNTCLRGQPGYSYRYPVILKAADSLAHAGFRKPQYVKKLIGEDKWLKL